MALDASTEPSGAERATDIWVVAGTEVELAEAADADSAANGASECENVGAGRGGGHGSILQQAGCGGRRHRPGDGQRSSCPQLLRGGCAETNALRVEVQVLKRDRQKCRMLWDSVPGAWR